jgi:hypothetical protein
MSHTITVAEAIAGLIAGQQPNPFRFVTRVDHSLAVSTTSLV